jgi:hypothetical protein
LIELAVPGASEFMKSSIIMIVFIVAGAASAAIGLSVCGVRFSPADPIAAGAIGTISALVGIMPVLRNRQADPVSVFQRAMAGTVLHLLVQITLAASLIAAHVIDMHAAMGIWLLGQYWVSLVVLIWQLRRFIVSTATLTKAQE